MAASSEFQTFMWILAIILGLIIIIALFGGCVRCTQQASKMPVESLINSAAGVSDRKTGLMGNSQVTVSDVVAQPAGGAPSAPAIGMPASGPATLLSRTIPSSLQASTSNVAAVDFGTNQYSSLAGAAAVF